MRYIFTILVISSCSFAANAQDFVFQTFKDTRVINAQSVETLSKRKLDLRIGHRFGDFAGTSGGWQTFYGLENAADVFIGVEYGVSDKLTIGISRTKGGGQLRKLVNPLVKYRLLQQKTRGNPISLTLFGVGSVSTMKKSSSPESVSNFQEFSHRVVYGVQAIVGRKFSDRFSLQATPSLIHRNLVPFGQDNNLISLGLASRIQLSRTMAFLLDLTVPFAGYYNSDNDLYTPIGFGFEFDTGGHVFQVNLTNARGMLETDYIPYSNSNWGDGEFRLGFTISRMFNL